MSPSAAPSWLGTGRRSAGEIVTSECGTVLAVDIGGTKLAAGLVDAVVEPAEEPDRPTLPSDHGSPAIHSSDPSRPLIVGFLQQPLSAHVEGPPETAPVIEADIDGKRVRAVPRSRGLESPSQDDRGTIVAQRGVNLYRLNRRGRRLNKPFTTPFRTNPIVPAFNGPFSPEVSPDGKTIAYTRDYGIFPIDKIGDILTLATSNPRGCSCTVIPTPSKRPMPAA